MEAVSICLDRISKKFSHRVKGEVSAVSDVSLQVQPGEFLTLLGPSGCGKTTTLRMIAGFEHPDIGRVHIGEEDVTEKMANQRNIGFVFQNYALFPHLSVFENVAYGLRVKGMGEAEIEKSVIEVLALGGLKGYERQFPHQLSGGEQQRVALARAVIIQPRVLLFDEPLSNLDAKLRVHMRSEIRRLQKALSITAIYVTHDQEEALALADTVVLMNQGQIVQTGTPQDIYLKPTTAFAAEFLGVSNQLEGEAEGSHLRIAGQRVPYTGSVRGKMTVIFRASDVQIEAAPGRERPDTISVIGELEESLFLGAHYRHYVRLAGAVVMADSPDSRPTGTVRVHVPVERVHPYHA